MTLQHIAFAAKQGQVLTETEARARVQAIAELAEKRRTLGEVK